MTNTEQAIKNAVKTLSQVLADLSAVDAANDIANAPSSGDHSKKPPVVPPNPLRPSVEPPASDLPPAVATTGTIPLADSQLNDDSGKTKAEVDTEAKAKAKADAKAAKEGEKTEKIK